MRIVILTQYFLPEMGAPQSRLYETAVGLQQRGWEVKVVTGMPNYPHGKIQDEYRGKFSMVEAVNTVDVNRYTLYPSKSRRAIPRIFSMLSFSFTSLMSFRKVKAFRPDYIFTESPPLTLGLTGLLLSSYCGAMHILNVSDLWPLSAFKLNAVSNGTLYKMLKKLERYLYKRSYACTGQSMQIVTYISGQGAARAHLYRNGVDITRFKDGLPPVARQVRLRIVYAGLLGVAQGMLNLCRQMDFDSLGAELHIYGSGAERSAIEHYLRENGSKGIFLHDTVQREAMPGLLSGYDAALVTLVKPLYGAVPSKIYEAMAAGLPIIFAGGGEGAEIIKDSKTGWPSVPGDYESLKSVIKSVAKIDAEELEQIRTNCLNAAKNIYNREIQIDSLHKFLLKGL